MTKILHLKIEDTCENCPYLLYDNEWGGYHCDLAHKQMMFTENCKYEWEEEIPTWCPLPDDK